MQYDLHDDKEQEEEEELLASRHPALPLGQGSAAGELNLQVKELQFCNNSRRKDYGFAHGQSGRDVDLVRKIAHDQKRSPARPAR